VSVQIVCSRFDAYQQKTKREFKDGSYATNGTKKTSVHQSTKQQHPKLLMKNDDALSTSLFLCHLISSSTSTAMNPGAKSLTEEEKDIHKNMEDAGIQPPEQAHYLLQVTGHT
jgi:hypothetical protein